MKYLLFVLLLTTACHKTLPPLSEIKEVSAQWCSKCGGLSYVILDETYFRIECVDGTGFKFQSLNFVDAKIGLGSCK